MEQKNSFGKVLQAKKIFNDFTTANITIFNLNVLGFWWWKRK